MPRNRVTTRFTRAARTPSARVKPRSEEYPLREPTGMSALTRYIEENRDPEITTEELIEQFQEYECDHSGREVISVSNTKIVTLCRRCRLMETKMKKDAE